MQDTKLEHPSTRREISGAVWSLASNLLSRGTGIIFTPIFTRILSPSEFGVYSLYTSLLGIFTVICTFEISGSAIYKCFMKYSGTSSSDFTSVAMGAESTLTLLSLTVYLIFRKNIDVICNLSYPLPAILIFQIFFNAICGIYFAKLRYSGDYRSVAFWNATQGLISPPLALLLIFLGIRETSRIYAQLAVTGGVAVFLLIKTLKKSKIMFSPEKWRYLFGILLPMLPHYLASSLLAQGDKIIVAKRIGEEAVGKYSAAFSVGHLTSLITGGIALALTPFIIRELSKGNTKKVEYAKESSVKLCCLFTLSFLCLLPEIFSLLVGIEYRDALSVAYLVAVSVIFSFSVTLINAELLFYTRSSIITKNTLTATLISLPLSYLSAESLGFVGCAFISLLSYITLTVISWASLVKAAPKGAIKLTNYLLVYTVMIGMAALIFILRRSLLARIPLFLAISALLLYELFKKAAHLIPISKRRGSS